MKISIITPVYNGESTIGTCIESVMNQNYTNYEHIIMDACSKDRTAEIVKSYNSDKIRLVSEKDKGSCDALNKGLKIANGDIICFLCADDMYFGGNVFEEVIHCFKENNIEGCYSDLVYVSKNDPKKVLRYWKSSSYKRGLYYTGWLPPFTTFFIKREVLDKSGHFNLDFSYVADFELLFRLLTIEKIKTKYIPKVLVKMRMGGVSNSSIRNIVKSLSYCYEVLKFHRMFMPILYPFLTLIYRFRQKMIPSSIHLLISKSTFN